MIGAAYSTVILYSIAMIGNMMAYVYLRKKAGKIGMQPVENPA